jgi:uncharacterized protein (DUF58 family)
MPAHQPDPEALLRRLEWTVIRRLDGLLQGNYRTLFRGFGLDLAELREYQFHDDVRYIDWNVTARLQTPYVRQYNEDREITAWFLVDLSRSMEFGSRADAKRESASGLVAVLARLLTRHGNRVGAMFYGEGVEAMIPARAGRRHVLQILSRMAARPPTAGRDGGGAGSGGSETRLDEFLAGAARFISRRSLVFIVSDFISAPGWASPLARLARRHEVLAVRLHDPLESELPDLGLVVVQDAETGEQLFVDTHDPGFRRRFAEAAQRREQSLQQAFREAGVDALELSTGDDLVETIMRFSELRKRRNQLTAGAVSSKSRGEFGDGSVA